LRITYKTYFAPNEHKKTANFPKNFFELSNQSQVLRKSTPEFQKAINIQDEMENA